MSKKIWWLVLIIVVVLLGWRFLSKQGSNLGITNPLQSPTPTPSPTAGAPAKPLTYTQAVQQYGSRRIQFDSLCHGTPGQMVAKKGTKVMLDNRTLDMKTLKFEGQTYTLGGYKFAIATMTTTKKLPYNIMIDCKSSTGGSTENVVTVTIEQ